jgi:hypothetical protein
MVDWWNPACIFTKSSELMLKNQYLLLVPKKNDVSPWVLIISFFLFLPLTIFVIFFIILSRDKKICTKNVALMKLGGFINL